MAAQLRLTQLHSTNIQAQLISDRILRCLAILGIPDHKIVALQ